MNPSDSNVPPSTPTESPSMGQRIYDTTSVHRISQVALVRDHLTAGISPATVPGPAAIIAQMESQLQAPLLSVTITSAFPGFRRSMSYQNGTWSGHDSTHHFHDDRASISYSSTNGGVQRNKIVHSNYLLRLLYLNSLYSLHLFKLESPLPLLLHVVQFLRTCLIVRSLSKPYWPHFKP